MVDLVLEAAGLEALRLDHSTVARPGPMPRPRSRSPAYVRGQVGDAETALARHLARPRPASPRVDQHQQTVMLVARGCSLTSTTTMRTSSSELRRGEPDATRVGAHGVDAGRRRPARSARRRRDRAARATRLSDGMRVAQDFANGHRAQVERVLLQRPDRQLYSLLLAARRAATARPPPPTRPAGARPPSSWRRAARCRRSPDEARGQVDDVDLLLGEAAVTACTMPGWSTP